MDDIDDEDDIKDEEAKEGETAGEDGTTPGTHLRKRNRKNKMHKKFSTSLFTLMLKFLVVVSVLEGYFLLCYF